MQPQGQKRFPERAPSERVSLQDPIKKSLFSWFQKVRANHPWRRLWKTTKDPYVVWVSEIMLQQTRIEAVIPKYIAFMSAFPNLQTLAKATEAQLRSSVAGLGYYRRFAWLQQAAVALDSAGEKLPDKYEELLSIKGIGPYTAAAISSICFGEPRAVCDGNIERIYCRLHNVQLPANDPSVKTSAAEWAELQVPAKKPGDWNEALMELGQKVCKPTSPECQVCPLQRCCAAYRLSTQHIAPSKKKKAKWKQVDLIAHVPVYQSQNLQQIGLVVRDDQHRFLRGMLGFDFKVAEAKNTDSEPREFHHAITNHKISGYIKTRRVRKKRAEFEWVDIDSLPSKLTSSLDHKIWSKVSLLT